ncbi:hypothetical protein [Fodinicola acaciae]|uniref:hypothetical protein n=1 Tax=Fodinicola acaciae TaxID=2681555 RepID=UPI0013CFFD07|nr:hypothetical protein [Fodinicola acaciae]
MEIWVAVITGATALLAAFVGVVATLIGALVTDRGAQRREEDARAERRNHTAREAYVRFLAALGDPRDLDALNRAAADVELLAPAPVIDAVRATIGKAQRLNHLLAVDDSSSRAVEEASTDLDAARATVRDAMRGDLGR